MFNAALANSPYAFDTAGQKSRAESAASRLRGLARQQQVVDDKRRGIAQEKLMPGELPRSPFLSEKDYLIDKNRQGEIASLTSELSGNGPVKAQYGGVMGAGGGATNALMRRGGYGITPNYGGGDPEGMMGDAETHAFKMRQMDVEDRINARESDALAGMRRAWNDPEERLHSGRAAAAERKIGDVRRSETVRDAANAGTSESERYFAPGQRELRQDRMFEDENRARKLSPYLPATINAQGNMGSAAIRRDATLGAAETNAGARVASSAVNTLGRLSGTPTFTPEDSARVDQGVDTIKPLVPGQGGPQPTKTFPRQMLQSFAQENGFQSEAQAMEYLRTQGYAVQ